MTDICFAEICGDINLTTAESNELRLSGPTSCYLCMDRVQDAFEAVDDARKGYKIAKYQLEEAAKALGPAVHNLGEAVGRRAVMFLHSRKSQKRMQGRISDWMTRYKCEYNSLRMHYDLIEGSFAAARVHLDECQGVYLKAAQHEKECYIGSEKALADNSVI